MITLDADTRMQRGVACRLVGTMAHPLNQPRFSAREGRVVEGYGIVQAALSNGFSASDCEEQCFRSIPAFRETGRAAPYVFVITRLRTI